MELRHLRYFVAVAEERNFTRAAVKVGIGQPPLSQQIKTLEQEVGAPLFRRVAHGAELTPVGLAFLPEAKAILAQAGFALKTARRAAKGEWGSLRVGYTSSAAFVTIVPWAIRTFKRAYPDVELSLREANTTSLLEQIRQDDLDAAFIRPGRGDPGDPQWLYLADEEMVIVLPASHPLAKAKALPLSALKKETFILFPRQAGPSLFDEVAKACRRSGFEPILGQEAPEISSVGNLVAAELGVSVVPASIAQVQVAGIKYLPILDDAPVARLALATRSLESFPVVQNFKTLVHEKSARSFRP